MIGLRKERRKELKGHSWYGLRGRNLLIDKRIKNKKQGKKGGPEEISYMLKGEKGVAK